MSKSKTTRRGPIIFWISFIIINLLVLFPFILFHNSLFVITSPSMSPELNVGDLVVKGEKNPEDIKVSEEDGDIIILKGPEYFYKNGFDPIFWNYLDNNTPIIHRAIDKKKVGSRWYFLTKGDNNLVPDGAYRILNYSDDYILIEYNSSKVIYISEKEILGVVIYKVPYLGYVNLFFPVIAVIIIIIFFIYFILNRLNYQIKIIKTSLDLDKK